MGGKQVYNNFNSETKSKVVLSQVAPKQNVEISASNSRCTTLNHIPPKFRRPAGMSMDLNPDMFRKKTMKHLAEDNDSIVQSSTSGEDLET